MKNRMLVSFALALMVAALPVMAQVNGAGGFNGAANRFNGSNMLRQQLAVNDDNVWNLLAPKIQKIISDQQALRVTGGRGFGRRNIPNQTTGADPVMENVTQSLAALNTVLQNPNAATDDLQVKGTALRQAREKAQAQLEAEQNDLRGLLTVRQEMVLVALGYLN